MRTPISKKLALIEEFHTILIRAAKSRPERGGWVDDLCEPWPRQQPQWVLYERQQMLEAVNVERLTRGLESASESDVKRVEQMAEGHTDYGSKFALYCTELALGETEIRP